MDSITRPKEHNALVWLDLGERIDSALQALRQTYAKNPSDRLRGKIAGVQDVQTEYQRLDATQEAYLSMFTLWIASRAEGLSAPRLRARRTGYRLVLDYIRSY